MRRFSYANLSIAGLLVLYIGLAGPTRSESRPQQAAVSDSTLAARIGKGAELYSRTCQRCHNPRGPAERTDREWVIIMQHMQTRGNLTYEQVKLVRDFLLASNDAGRAPGRERTGLATPTEYTPEMVAAGKAVFEGRGTCFACHGVNLQGGPIAPNLTDATWRNGTGDFPSILHIVRNGVPGTAMAAYPGGISDEEAQQVAAYVASMSQEKSGQ